MKNLDESVKSQIKQNVELFGGDMVIKDTDMVNLFESLHDEVPVQADRQEMYIKMANQQQKYLDENLNTTQDIAGFEKQLQPMLRRMIVALNAPQFCSIQPVSAPQSAVFALKPRYTGYKSTESDNPLIVVHAKSAGGNKMAMNDVVNGNGGAKGKVIFVEKDGLMALIEVTVAGDGFKNGDTLISDIIVTTSFSNELFFKQVLPSYTGQFATPIGERLGETAGGDGKEWAEIGINVDKLPVSVETRKLKARLTIELIQDLNKLFGLQGMKEVQRFMSAEIALEIDMQIVDRYKTIAKVLPDFVPVTATHSQGRWAEEMFKGLYQKVLRVATGISESSRRGRGNIMITTAGVIAGLQAVDAFSTSVDVNSNNNFYIGTLKNGIKVFHDFYYAGDKDYCLIIRKGTSAFDAPLIYSPYIPLMTIEATDPNTLQPIVGLMSRYGLTENTLQDNPSDSVVYFNVDMKETALVRE